MGANVTKLGKSNSKANFFENDTAQNTLIAHQMSKKQPSQTNLLPSIPELNKTTSKSELPRPTPQPEPQPQDNATIIVEEDISDTASEQQSTQQNSEMPQPIDTFSFKKEFLEEMNNNDIKSPTSTTLGIANSLSIAENNNQTSEIASHNGTSLPSLIKTVTVAVSAVSGSSPAAENSENVENPESTENQESQKSPDDDEDEERISKKIKVIESTPVARIDSSPLIKPSSQLEPPAEERRLTLLESIERENALEQEEMAKATAIENLVAENLEEENFVTEDHENQENLMKMSVSSKYESNEISSKNARDLEKMDIESSDDENGENNNIDNIQQKTVSLLSSSVKISSSSKKKDDEFAPQTRFLWKSAMPTFS